MLVCGPPGAGKSTVARSLGLAVFDLDDPEWEGSESAFSAAIAGLRGDPDARAVVIRSGATRSARDKAAALIGATEVVILDTDLATCRERIKSRRRQRPSIGRQMAAAEAWWAAYEPPPVTVVSRDW